MSRTTALLAVMLASLVPALARAERFGAVPESFTTEHTTKGPVRGYSGFYRVGPRDYYCDYQRIPNRRCTTDRKGHEQCKIVSWELKQFCY
jgi:hypothetical protein